MSEATFCDINSLKPKNPFKSKTPATGSQKISTQHEAEDIMVFKFWSKKPLDPMQKPNNGTKGSGKLFAVKIQDNDLLKIFSEKRAARAGLCFFKQIMALELLELSQLYRKAPAAHGA